MMDLQIKRYLNRKLYNSVTKRYITIDEIGELVREGEDIVVTDSASGEDITSLILTQVIMSQEKKGDRSLSQHVLFELIRARNDTLDLIKQFFQRHPVASSYLSVLDIPTRADFDKLVDQIDGLTRVIDEIVSEKK